MEAATQLLALLSNLAMHDRRTRGHCERVRAYNDLIAEDLGLSQADRDRLRWAALIHDIGKLKVPARLLNKPGKPTAQEWATLRAHPLRGAQLAAPIADWLGPWADAIEQHHERWDGAGYPHGLSGSDISLGARIVAVADAFEVMTSPRPYSRAISAEAGRAEIAACAGTHFDPMVVRAFLNISLGRLRRVMGPVAWLMQVPFLSGMPRLEAAIVEGTRHAATGAGTVAGVVAVTTLTPGGHTHIHPQPVAAEAEAPPTHAGPLLPFAAQLLTQDPPSAHSHQPARVRGVHVSKPAKSGHHHATGHRGHAAAGVRERAASTTPATHSHGRCTGNSGAGLGNGGPRDGGHAKARLAALRHGVSRALGLHACD
jgi:putative nucleotidyltransferase with HDIG domain